ncbi:interleukin-17 receptor C [Latimeria chalumnae]|uniref:interleukin-17 receptor C n=1 Tax=Latimeria chalumnae TaxID=7897 RepID=UPI00313DE465
MKSALCFGPQTIGTLNSTLFICAGLECMKVKIRLPLSQLEPSASPNVGTVEYNCFKITQLSDSLIKSYTEPRYSDVLDHIHSVPGCNSEAMKKNVELCQSPAVTVTVDVEKKVAFLKVQSKHAFHTWLYYNVTQTTGPHARLGFPWLPQRRVLSHFQNVTQEVKVEFADIFPCLCYEMRRSGRTFGRGAH